MTGWLSGGKTSTRVRSIARTLPSRVAATRTMTANGLRSAKMIGFICCPVYPDWRADEAAGRRAGGESAARGSERPESLGARRLGGTGVPAVQHRRDAGATKAKRQSLTLPIRHPAK